MSFRANRPPDTSERPFDTGSHQDGPDHTEGHKGRNGLSFQHLDGADFVTTSVNDARDLGTICLSTSVDFLLPKRSIYRRLLYPQTVDRVLFLRLRFSEPGSDATVGLSPRYPRNSGSRSPSVLARCRPSGRSTGCNFAMLGISCDRYPIGGKKFKFWRYTRSES